MRLGLPTALAFALLACPAAFAAELPADIAAEVAKRRGRTALSKLAAGMRPGTWAELECKRPPGLMSVATGTKYPSGKKKHLHIAGWTDDGHWDSRTGQFLYMGYRVRLKFIAYSEEKNEWRVIPGPFGWDTAKGVPGKGPFKDTRERCLGHVYAKNGFDQEKGAFYHTIGGHTYRYDVAAGTWAQFPGGSGMNDEFFPGLGLMAHGDTKQKGMRGKLLILDEEKKEWKPLAKIPFSPHHALARYNPFRKEMLLIAGNDIQTVVSVTAKGKVTPLKDTPEQMTIRHAKLLVDPVSGLYLMFIGGNLYEFDSAKNQYHKVEGYKRPFSKYEMPVPAVIPEYGVIMWIDKKVRLYKHKAGG
jgi:hypothetical protein